MLKRSILKMIALYQRFISPLIPPRCRFYPTCSQYGAEAIERHGPFKGVYLALRRLLRCHPFHPGGFDPVPRGEGVTKGVMGDGNGEAKRTRFSD